MVPILRTIHPRSSLVRPVGVILLALSVLAACRTDPGTGGGTTIAGTPAPASTSMPLGDDSCRWARDGECDDSRFAGTGACPIATDATDCRLLARGSDDSCRWADDGECDEPGIGTGACAEGTDRSDCAGVAQMRNRDNSCASSFDGRCDEPGSGSGKCPARSDTVDCIGRATLPGMRDHHFGYDDRVVVDTSRYPWSAIGALMFSSGGMCTATLVADNIVITAAHCFFQGDSFDRPTVFVAGREGNRQIASANAVQQILAPGYDQRLHSQTSSVNNRDWAFVLLDQPIGRVAGTLGIHRLTPGDLDRAVSGGWYRMSQAGYSWDSPNRMTGHNGCRIVRAFANGTIHHECDTTRGDSGSPIFIEDNGRYYIVAVDSKFDPVPGGRSNYLAVDSRSFADAFDALRAGL